jgi:hypothetical protein
MKRALLVLSLVVPSMLGATACSSTPGGVQSDAGPAMSDAPTTPVTYYGDVRPILAAHCTRCHYPNGIAPIPLDSYASAMGASALMVAYTSSRRMPPFLADNSGACENFDTNDWLSDAELGTLAAWDAQHTPEGDPSTPPPMQTPIVHIGTGPNIHTIDTGVDYAPHASVTDDYHCFVVMPPAGGYVTGAEVHPQNARIVHHVIVYEPQDAQGVSEVMAADAATPEPGYTCFGGGGSDHALPIVLWAPGTGASYTPRGTGLRIDATRPLIIQVHYNLLNVQPGDTDRSSIDIQIDANAIPGFFLPALNYDFVAPPHMQAYTSGAVFPFGQTWLAQFGVQNAHIYGVGPHMHTLGTDIRVDLVHGSGSPDQCMVHIPRWDFNWQRGYSYVHPLAISANDSVRVTCTWNTSTRDTAVSWGEGTQDEMCLAFLYVSE